jgi:hypothetical protein
MPRGQRKAELVLTDDEKQTLKTWANRPKSTHQLANGPGSSWPAPRGWTIRSWPPGSPSAPTQ